MEFEFWWLLALPLFFGLGWLAARIDLKHLLNTYAALPASYFKGLSFLINDQQEKAIEAFSEAVMANAHSMELNFALGSLLRRRGEFDRAIHLHLSLLENSTFTPQQVTAIKAELAHDYLKAGLLDRAEELFITMTDVRYRQSALRALLEIYVCEREWQRAIQTATELEGLSGVSFRLEISHYYCELAQQAMLNNNVTDAYKELNQALQAYPKCTRANILLGDLKAQSGQHDAATTAWRQIEFQSPNFLGLVAHKLLNSYRTLNDFDCGLALLSEYLNTYGLESIREALYEMVFKEKGAEDALVLVRDNLHKYPSLTALHQFLRALSEVHPNEDNQLMQQIVHHALANKMVYTCTQCGFKAKYHHWQCPACSTWESLPAEPAAP